MAHETVTKSQRFYCVSLTPDICKTPVGNTVVPLPYNITGEFKDAQAVSKDVKTHGEPVFLHNKSYIPSVKGDERGTLGGIKSGTFMKKVESLQFSPTKGSNGTQTIQESRLVWMNDRNTVGRVLERAVQAPRPRLTLLGWEVPTAKEAAQNYKDNYSESIHKFGTDAVDVGGKIGMGSAGLAGAGVLVGATGVGAPVAVVMEGGAAIGGTVAAGVGGVGLAADSGATVADKVADYIITGKMPDVVGAAKDIAVNAVEGVVLKKLTTARSFFKRFFKKKDLPGKTPPPPQKPPKQDKGGGDKDGRDGGKTKQAKEPKRDKPSDCCPKNGAPGGKRVKSAHPVHFGTGEEILSQTDFVIDGPTPLEWARTYRSGSETEDWGLLGARWATPYTSSLSVCPQGVVYHDASGRALRLPRIAVGQQHDHRGEGFILRRDSDAQFSLTWRDGSVDTFVAGLESWLPHGYDGVNAMLAPRAAVRTERFYLSRRAERDGTGITIERHHAAQPGEVLLRVRQDDGMVIEAMRDACLPAETGPDQLSGAPRIGRIDQVLADGTRVCHVRYRYEAELPLVQADGTQPLRCNLVEQTNISGHGRRYAYRHHLLVRYTTYTGFEHGLQWVSLSFLRERWAGNTLDDAMLAERHPISTDNSYQARAVRTTTADGRNEVAIAYVDADTTRVTEPDGGILEYTFDANWLATSVRRVGPDRSMRLLGAREWDRDGMLLADVDADGAATRYGYDAAGNLTSVTDAQDHVTRIDYDADNLPVVVTDALGHATQSRYDKSGRLIERTDALGRRTGYAYDVQGRLSVVTDARGGSNRLDYDGAGRLASYTDCSGFTSRYAYDESQRLAQQIDAMGNTTGYAYDTLGRVTGITHPDGTREHFEYDLDGNLLVHTDPKGQRMRYRYDGHGSLVERIDAKDQKLQYRYDKSLRLTELINGNDESYLFGYDAEGRLTSETGFDGKTTTYTYSNAGHLIGSECAGVRTDLARDSLGRLLAKSNPDGAVRYAYDALGRLVASANREAENRFMYDAVGQLVDERMAYAPGPVLLPGQEVEPIAAFTMTHAYDELGNRIQTILPNGRRIDTLRYGSGHWHGTLWQGKTLVDVERDHLHRETVRELGNASERLTERRSYDPQSRLSSFSLDKGETRLRERRYGYDSTGNLVHIHDEFIGSTRYTYDPLGQLLSAVQPGLIETFAFDPAGNLLDSETTPSGIDTRRILRELDEQPGAGTKSRRFAKVTHNLLRQYSGYNYEYDVQGNTVVKRARATNSANDEGTLTFEYDADNRLTVAVRTTLSSRMVARYSYDAFGRRIGKQVIEQDWGTMETRPPIGHSHRGRLTLFVWDGDVMVQEIDTGTTLTFVYEPNSFVPLARISSTEGIDQYPPYTTNLTNTSESQLWSGRNPDDQVQMCPILLAKPREQFRHDHGRGPTHMPESDARTDDVLYCQCDHLGTPT